MYFTLCPLQISLRLSYVDFLDMSAFYFPPPSLLLLSERLLEVLIIIPFLDVLYEGRMLVHPLSADDRET